LNGGATTRGSTPATPTGPASITWGTGDVVAAWLAGVVASVVAVGFGIDANTPVGLVAALTVQNVTIIAWLVGVARLKGRGTLSSDFGFALVPRRGRWYDGIPWLVGGAVLQLVAVLPILLVERGKEATQNVVDVADRAHGLEVPLMILAVAVLAPITEELLFRGALLRSLLRRMEPGYAVLVSALVFGLVHFSDPSLGTVRAVPGIVLLGLVSGYAAVTTGDLSRSIMLHVGFNGLSALILFTDASHLTRLH
jgi:membrane protease YdiL (CAAX protease family)